MTNQRLRVPLVAAVLMAASWLATGVPAQNAAPPSIPTPHADRVEFCAGNLATAGAQAKIDKFAQEIRASVREAS
jgi:hypothetical protein